ncbi:NTE family protein [Natranaerovirga pectinivora]|uniref:NTE family protein n=1 Tax=Natranaerovirga pectinivora TaxID=682400 RepID=A0A4R3MJR5_9FIRM|nr:patatin-like phospholipase family protein [Natranaerovirga pectinivora]TCT12841.1 NTE family protein [Natranaerovirga pectinivora]
MEGIGLVLAGGGGKGAYHIGVWKALKEFGADENITAVSGTSVGALNGVLFSQGNYKIAEDVWLNITKENILKLDVGEIKDQVLSGLSGFSTGQSLKMALPMTAYLASHYKSSIFSREGLLEIIDESINLEYVATNGIPCFATCLEVPVLNKKAFNIQGMTPNRIKSILLATSALPVIFQKIIIDGVSYIDGGIPVFGDNVPVKPLYDLGYKVILVAHLSRESILDTNAFPGAKIIQIVPREHQGELLDGTLDFTKEGAKRRIQQGYEDTIKILKPLYDMGMVQGQMYQQLNKMVKDEYIFEEKRQHCLEERENLKNQLNHIGFKLKGK